MNAKKSLRYEINDENPAERKRFIRRTFDAISPTYDLLNRILSFGIDQIWRRGAIRALGDIRGRAALDLCAGTGDFSRILRKRGALTVSLDFSLEMLTRGIARRRIDIPVAADAALLPFKPGSFSIMTIAFGIRNIPDINTFIMAARGVLAPGGDFVILELTRPANPLIRFLYRIYLFGIIPILGGLISGRMLAYRYLSETISSFIDPGDLCSMLEREGFDIISRRARVFGVATVIHCRSHI